MAIKSDRELRLGFVILYSRSLIYNDCWMRVENE